MQVRSTDIHEFDHPIVLQHRSCVRRYLKQVAWMLRLQASQLTSRTSARSHSSPRRQPLVVRAEVFQAGNSWVVTRSSTLARRYRTKGVVHFVGGAFAGAAPQVVYSLLLDILASGGYTVVATPFAVTFDHLSCAASVRLQFKDAVQALRADGKAWLAPENVPILGVGHSMGSLMHLLMGAAEPGATRANVLMSFNNKQVQDAIPIPGFLSQLSPVLRGIKEGSIPVPQPPIPVPDAAALLAGAASLLPKELGWDSAGQISRAALALEQVGSVFGEVGNGATDFTPTPAESREIIRKGYTTPTLLVRFANDTIDETPDIEGILQGGASSSRRVQSLVLPGSHVTPCGGDIALPAGRVFTPVDAALQLGKAVQQQDIRRLGDQVVSFLDSAIAY